MTARENKIAAAQRGHWLEVLAVFLRLGLTSFGGPVAHLGYFRDELVHRRRWLDDRGYADLVALCQFLPGPNVVNLAVAVGARFRGAAGAAVDAVTTSQSEADEKRGRELRRAEERAGREARKRAKRERARARAEAERDPLGRAVRVVCFGWSQV